MFAEELKTTVSKMFNCFDICNNLAESISLCSHLTNPIHRNIRVTRVIDLIRVITLHATVMASGPLAYLVSCSVASNDYYQVSYF